MTPGTSVANRSAPKSATLVVAAVLAAALLAFACEDFEPPPPIHFDQARLTIQNRTDRAWAEVEIWVNDHYRVQLRSIAPGQVATVDFRTFVAGFGQRFEPKRQQVYGIEVSAREGSRREVKLTWGKGKKH